MAMSADQLREVITQTLKESQFVMSLDGAVELLLMTAAVESNFGTYIRQITGPALGIFQCEPATHDDLVWRFLPSRPDYLKLFLKFCWNKTEFPTAITMKHNLQYAVLIARLKYLTVPAAMPTAKDTLGLAMYWKKYYNTHLGAGTIEGAIKKYNLYCK